MKVSKRQTVLLTSAAAAMAVFVGVQASQPARADASQTAAGPQRVDDFFLADQDLLGRQLYRHADDKAVVLVAYAPGDAQVHADAKALMALKAAYAGKGVDVLAIDSRLGDKRADIIADAK